MFPALAAAAGVSMCAQAIGDRICKVSNPVLHDFWEAALQGNSAIVHQMIRDHDIPPDVRHHVSGASLVIELASARADNDARDRGLAAVLRTLAKAGWSLAPRHRVTGANALHLLAGQPLRCFVVHRLKAVVDADIAQPTFDTLLDQKDWKGLRPEDKAPAVGDGRRVRVRLAAARRRMEFRVQRTQQRLMWRAGWSNGSVVSEHGISVTQTTTHGRVRMSVFQAGSTSSASASFNVGLGDLLVG